MSHLNSKKEFFHLISFIKPRAAGYIIGLLGCSLVGAGASLLTSFIMVDLVNSATFKDISLLIRALTIICLLVLTLCIFAPIFGYIFRSSVKHIMAEARLKVFKHIEGIRSQYFEKTHSGEVISRITNDVQVMEFAISDNISSVVSTCVSGISSAVLMFFFDWRIASVLIFLGINSALANIFYARPIRKISDNIQKHLGIQTERLSDLINGFNIIKMFKIQEFILQKFDNANCKISKYSMDSAKVEALQEGTNFLLGWLNFGGIMAVGSLLALNGSINFGKLAGILQLSNSVTFMFLQIGGFVAQLQGSLAGVERVLELLDEPLEEEKYNINAENSKSMIEIQNLSFSYEEGQHILEGLSLKAGKGQVIALVGPSGGGKSTIIKLLMGFYPPEGGGMVIDGKPLGHYSLSELRGLTAYVPQDAYLFEGTIEENIRYGKLDASKDEVIAAAKAANAHSFILEQPEGYDTMVGERGAKLSGGQRQRIAIARAILKNAPILLLDEATSALDSESEQLVQEALNELMKGRTTIAVAHRLSTVEHADIIYVIDKGKVVEKGTHKELSTGSGLYNRLYELQFQKQEVAAARE